MEIGFQNDNNNNKNTFSLLDWKETRTRHLYNITHIHPTRNILFLLGKFIFRQFLLDRDIVADDEHGFGNLVRIQVAEPSDSNIDPPFLSLPSPVFFLFPPLFFLGALSLSVRSAPHEIIP